MTSPFYVESLPCESCGLPCETRERASWDLDLLVGECCRLIPVEEPDNPRCPDEYRLVVRARTVGELIDTCRVHRASCVVCNPHRKGIQSEVRTGQRREVA